MSASSSSFGAPPGRRLADVLGRIDSGEEEAAVAGDYGVPLADVRAALALPASVAT